MNKVFEEHHVIELEDGSKYEYDLIEKDLSVKDELKLKAAGYVAHPINTVIDSHVIGAVDISIGRAYINIDRHKIYVDSKCLAQAIKDGISKKLDENNTQIKERDNAPANLFK